MTEPFCTPDASIPDVRPRPSLDRWLRDRCLTLEQGGRMFGCSKQMLGLICLPFDDPKRKPPGRKLLTTIVRVTDGAVRPGDFSPPVEAILRGMAA